MSADVLVAIPVFNEERYVTRVLAEVKEYSQTILVIDDGSTDRTAELLRQVDGIHVLTHLENRGYGKSLADAFDYARRHEFDWLITMDCDEQHEACYVPKFTEDALASNADIISGTRYPHGFTAEASGAAPVDRRTINRQITAMLNEQLGLGITDAFCGFKAYRVATLDCFRITVPGYAMPLQFWVQAARAGLRVRELPISLVYNDPTRHFGGILDDPDARLAHYQAVFDAELKAPPIGAAPRCGSRASCRQT